MSSSRHSFGERAHLGGSSIGNNRATAKSIVKAMDDFMAAVNNMRGVVMVPNRLKDLEISVPAELPSYSPKSVPSSGPSSLAIASSGPSSLALASGPPSLALAQRSPSVVPVVPTTEVDLYTFYQTLDSIHQELVCGPNQFSEEGAHPTSGPASISSLGGGLWATSSESTDDDFSNSSDGASSVDSDEYRVDHSRRLTESFRQHLQGLFSVLHQLTETANILSERYQDEVSEPSGNLI